MTGRRLGHYEIQEKLGEGGMGVVYRAQDTTLHRPVAVKVVSAALAQDDTARARLLREARTASALNHPNICTIYEAGEADGLTYIAMEYVEGKPLSVLVASQGLAPDAVVRYSLQIAAALAHAHERSVVHRDLKCANVMITPDARVKVLDFGLAKRLTAAEVAETVSAGSLSDPGSVAGTIAYLAPETLQGEPADARSDVWALGIVLYECLTGRRPFQGRTLFDTTSAILRETPPPLPDSVPVALRGVVQRCLIKEAPARYQRAGEVWAALQTLDDSSRSVPFAPAPRKFTRRKLAKVVGAAAGGFAVGFTFKFVRKWRQTGPKMSANREATETFQRGMFFLKSQFDLERARQLLQRAIQIDPKFAEARGWYAFTHFLMVDAGYSNDTKWIYQAEQEARRALADDASSARAHSVFAAVHLYLGRKELARQEAERALEIDPWDIDGHIWLANYHMFNGDYTRAQSLLKRLSERDPLFVVPLFLYADTLRQQGDPAGATRELEKVLDVDQQNTAAHSILALIHLNTGDATRARESLERITPRDAKTYPVRLTRALLLAVEGKRQEARNELDSDVLKYAELVLLSTSCAAEVFAVLGEKDQALDWLERAVRAGDERVEWFRRNPHLANVRDHPRFAQILESIERRRGQR